MKLLAGALLGMQARVFRLSQNYQILRAIVVAYAVDVMDMFMPLQDTTRLLFHDQSMFQDIALHARVRVIWGENPYVAIGLFESLSFRKVALLPTCVVAMYVQTWVSHIAIRARDVLVGYHRLLSTSAQAIPMSWVIVRRSHARVGLLLCEGAKRMSRSELVSGDEPMRHTAPGLSLKLLSATTFTSSHAVILPQQEGAI